jgi:hypothetical protein
MVVGGEFTSLEESTDDSDVAVGSEPFAEGPEQIGSDRWRAPWDAKVETSERQIHPLDEVDRGREKSGLVWKKIDGVKMDLATDNRRVVAW